MQILRNSFGVSAAIFLMAAQVFGQGNAEGSDIINHPVIAGYERFQAHEASTEKLAQGGWLLISELGCQSCHRLDSLAASPFSKNPAPPLNDVGDRLNVDWMRQFLNHPHTAKPGTRMPDLLGGLTASARAERIEALVHFLASLKGEEPPAAFRAAVDVEDGRNIYNQAGCVACHAPMDQNGKFTDTRDRTVLPLPDLKSKYRNGSALAQFLKNPHQWRSGGRMPSMNLDDTEALSISAAFGLSISSVIAGIRDSDEKAIKDSNLSQKLEPGIHWQGYSGSWGRLPEFDDLTPVSSGTLNSFSIDPFKGKNGFGMVQRAYIQVKEEGLHTFYTWSDDGSRLFIGPILVVDNDGTHGPGEKSGSIELKPGRHAVTVEFFEQGGGEELEVFWTRPGSKKETISSEFLFRTPDGSLPMSGRLIKETGFIPDSELVEKGRAAFIQTGCIQCHTLDGVDPDPSFSQRIPSLEADSIGGCLAEEIRPGLPDYSLNSKQVTSLKAALQPSSGESTLSASARIDLKMTELNCYACHKRDGKGGVETGSDSFFVSRGEDMGEEGRLPPHLNDSGVKLKLDWLTEVLAKGTKVRPYMATRMPVFGKDAIGNLASDIKSADQHLSGPEPDRPALASRDIMRFGRQLVGLKGMGCITCHKFNGQNAMGMQAIDLKHIVGRLEREWYSRYLVDPNSLRPGTRMPSFWPEGESVLPQVLEGTTARQHEVIWKYLEAIPNVSLPQGLNRNEILLAPVDGEAVIYRNFIQGAGPRAIGVGYAGEINLAWDANHLRPGVIWKGEFIDASKHWIGRGPGYQKPYGYSSLELPSGPSVAELSNPLQVWPTAGTNERLSGEFSGMRLDDRRQPTFLFQVDSVSFSDFFMPALRGEERFLRRRLQFSAVGSVENLYFRAGAGNSVAPIGDRLYRIDDRLKIRLKLPDGFKAVVRSVQNRKEIVVPLNQGSGPGEIIQDFFWD